MYTSPRVLEKVSNQGHFFNSSKPTARLTPAGPDHATIAACAGIIDYYGAVFDHHFSGKDTVALFGNGFVKFLNSSENTSKNL